MEQVRIGVFVRKGRGGGVFGVVVEPGLATPPPPAAYMLTLSFSGPTVAQRRFRFGHQASQSGKGQGPFARILYINMDHRMDRRKHMESWLSRESPVPYRRVRAHAGNESSQCVPGKQSPARCRGIAGLASTLVRTIDQLEGAAGDTLILEDDVYVRVAELRRHVARVPDDWEVIRFDCFGYVPPSFKFVEDDIFEPRHIRPCSARSLKLNTSYPKEAHCWFCGGTFAMLIRESSRSKLRKIWSRQPNDDPDCILSRGWWPYQDGRKWPTTPLKTYCLQAGIVDFIKALSGISDHPKKTAQRSNTLRSNPDCSKLPASMNNGDSNLPGCPGAVWSNNAGSYRYCSGDSGKYPWWQKCCVWDAASATCKAVPLAAEHVHVHASLH